MTGAKGVWEGESTEKVHISSIHSAHQGWGLHLRPVSNSRGSGRCGGLWTSGESLEVTSVIQYDMLK